MLDDDLNFCLKTKTMDKTLNLNISEACAHVVQSLSSGLKKDGKKITFVVLVETKKEEKENITLLKKAMSSQKSPSWSSKGKKTLAGSQAQRRLVAVTVLKNHGPRKAPQSRGGKT